MHAHTLIIWMGSFLVVKVVCSDTNDVHFRSAKNRSQICYARRPIVQPQLAGSMCLDGIITYRLYPRHHLLLRDKMINSLQQAKQTLHTPTPLIEYLIRIPRFRKRHHSRRSVNLGIHRFRSDELADITFRFLFVQIEELGKSVHLYPGVVFRYDTDIMLDDSLSQILPPRMGFGIFWVFGCGEDVVGAEMGAVCL